MLDPDSLVGKKLDQFRLDQYVARGAMGMIYKAFDTVLVRTVALKLIPKAIDEGMSKQELAAREEARKRLIQEAKAAGRLSHPNIVTIHSYGETDDYEYICMEFVQGRTLSQVLQDQKVLSVEEVLPIIENVLQALECANQEHIVHRDIKPSNIMITSDGRAKVMDFGIAKLPSFSMTVTGTVLGTPYYMSPEQISGQKVDIRSDLFSLGAVLYEIVTGERPFEAENTATLAYKIVQLDPIPPKVLNIHVPEAVGKIISKALTKDPTQRYQTPAEMLRDIRAVGRKPPVGAADSGDSTVLVDAADMDGTVQLAGSPEETVLAQSTPGGSKGMGRQATPPAQTTGVSDLANESPEAESPEAPPTAPPPPPPPPKTRPAPVEAEAAKPVPPPAASHTPKTGKAAAAASTKTPAPTISVNRRALGIVVLVVSIALIGVFFLGRGTDRPADKPVAPAATQSGVRTQPAQPAQPVESPTTQLSTPMAPSPPGQSTLPGSTATDYPSTSTPAPSSTLTPPSTGGTGSEQVTVELPTSTEPQTPVLPTTEATQAPTTQIPATPATESLLPTPADQTPSAADSMVQEAKDRMQADPAGARKLLEEAARMSPNHFGAHYNLGRLLTIQKDYAGAVRHYQDALRLNNRAAEVYFNLGYIYMNQGAYDLAKMNYESCLALAPSFKDEALTNLGIVQMKLNKPEEAKALFQQALEVNPNNRLAKSYLSKLDKPVKTIRAK